MRNRYRQLRGLGLLAVLAAAVGCGGKDGDAGAGTPAQVGVSGPQADALRDSWMYLVGTDAAKLQPFEAGTTGEAWLSFFHNDLRGAIGQFAAGCTPSDAPIAAQAASGYACVGLARGHLELAELFGTAAELDRVALRQFYLHRAEHAAEVLPSRHEDWFAGVVELHSGERPGLERIQRYLGRADADPLLKAVGQAIVAGWDADPLVGRIWGGKGEDAPAGSELPGAKLADLPASPAADAYRRRLDFIVAVARGNPSEAEAALRAIPAQSSDLAEELEQGKEAVESAVAPAIPHHDPAWLAALSRFHALRALEAVGGSADLGVLRAQAERLLGRPSGAQFDAPGLPDGLALVIFSACPTSRDLVEAERAHPARAATLRRLGTPFPALATAPTKEMADLDPFLDVSNNVKVALGEMLRAAGPQGGNMDQDMGLAERLRGQLLRERAGQIQAAFAVRLDRETGADIASAGVAAQSLLELALDKNPSPPNERLKAARISFRNDPPALAELARAQLDTRHPYDANDYIRPLTEVYPELIPLREALAALDSAWNPARKGSVR